MDDLLVQTLKTTMSSEDEHENKETKRNQNATSQN